MPGPVILLVEDSAADIGLVREALEEHDVQCELFVINNGERAIRYFDQLDNGEQAPPDLVVLDLNLPKMPGIEVLKRVRASRNPDIPVIVLTSSDDQKDREAVAAFRPSRYLQKPTNLEAFLTLGAVFKDSLKR